MKALLISLTITSVVAIGDLLTNFDLHSEMESAKGRFQNDFLLGVWYRANEAIVESREQLLRLYTHYTLQQAEQVIEHIAKYRNITQKESAAMRDIALKTKNISQIMELTNCIFKYEDGTIQAYKMTGYNLHNCIRMAQLETENNYLTLMQNFERIKNASLEMHNYYSKAVENCLDKICILATLIQSVVHYEKLQEEIATNVTEINGLNTKYLLTHVALGCVSKSIIQIEENYNIGKGLVNDCFLPKNETLESVGKRNETEETQPGDGDEIMEMQASGYRRETIDNQTNEKGITLTNN